MNEVGQKAVQGRVVLAAVGIVDQVINANENANEKNENDEKCDDDIFLFGRQTPPPANTSLKIFIYSFA